MFIKKKCLSYRSDIQLLNATDIGANGDVINKTGAYN